MPDIEWRVACDICRAPGALNAPTWTLAQDRLKAEGWRFLWYGATQYLVCSAHTTADVVRALRRERSGA